MKNVEGFGMIIQKNNIHEETKSMKKAVFWNVTQPASVAG
jgi:hypothetical protein